MNHFFQPFTDKFVKTLHTMYANKELDKNVFTATELFNMYINANPEGFNIQGVKIMKPTSVIFGTTLKKYCINKDEETKQEQFILKYKSGANMYIIDVDRLNQYFDKIEY